jgi:hypothetical protein
MDVSSHRHPQLYFLSPMVLDLMFRVAERPSKMWLAMEDSVSEPPPAPFTFVANGQPSARPTPIIVLEPFWNPVLSEKTP